MDFKAIYLCYPVEVDWVKSSARSGKIFFIFFLFMDMENGEKVSKQGYLCPQDSKGGSYPQDSAGGGVITPRILGGGGT